MAEEKNLYVTNAQLLTELIKLKETNQVSDELHMMFMEMAKGIGSRPNFRNYTYIDDMVSEAYLRCVKYAHNMLKNKKESCDEGNKNNNPFGYFSLVIWRSFLAHIKKEKSYQRKKWNELRKLVEQMEYEFKIKFDFNQNIVDRMYQDVILCQENVEDEDSESIVEEIVETEGIEDENRNSR